MKRAKTQALERGPAFFVWGDLWPWIPNPDPLRSSFIAWNSWTTGLNGHDPNESKSITWKLTGLPPKTKFDICFYNAVADMDRGFDITLAGLIMGVPTFNSANLPRPSCVAFSTVASNPKGVITGVAAGVGDSTMAVNEANWSGFQIVQVSSPHAPRRLGFLRSPN